MKSLPLFLALLCVAALAQTPRKVVAVYMAGKEPATVKGAYKVLGSELAKTITKSKEYTAADRSEAGRKIVASEQIFQRSGAVDPKQIKRLGKQLGVDIVCIAEITEVMKSHYLEARLVDVETTEIFNIASKVSNISNASDIVRTADAVAYELVAGEPKIVTYSFREVEFNPDGAIADYTDAIRQKPNVAEYYMKRAYAYNIKKDYDRAISDYSEAIRLGPKEVSTIYGENATLVLETDYSLMTYYNRGLMYYNKGDHDRAIADYNEVIRIKPDFAEAYNNRGVAYKNKGDYDRAIADYKEAIRLNPNDALAYLNRGRASHKKSEQDGYTILEQGLYNEAISDYTQAIRLGLDPDNTEDAYYDRGRAYWNEGYKDKAISDFSEVIRLNPKEAWAYYQRGRAYLGKDDNKAISDFTQTIRLNPNFVEAYTLRGNAYSFGKKDYKKAIADYESALRINPDYSYAQERLEEVREEMTRKVQSNVPSGGGMPSSNTSSSVFTDTRDGKKYKTVKIGSQTWMAENLNYAANGSKCYDNNSGNCAKYGHLYDWNTARSACPSGWHLPSYDEWDMLSNAVGGEKIAGKKLKAKSGWKDNGNGTDDYGFSALPGGDGDSDGSFSRVGYYGCWWSASKGHSDRASRLNMNWSGDHAYWLNSLKSDLFSVRCVQD